MMDVALAILIALIAVALIFDFLNGLHDAANSIATIVSTRVLGRSTRWFGQRSSTSSPFCSSGCMSPIRSVAASYRRKVDARVIFGALMGAISWNLITWYYGIPSSSSHALIGGLIGAGIAKAGLGSIVWSGVIKTASAIVLSPMTGFFLALLLMLIVTWLFVRMTPYAVDSTFAVCSSFRLRSIRLAMAATMPEDDGDHRGAALFLGP